ncbi:synaptojanin-2-binding protein [Oryzias latipes]|uniref:synaptojanin-2-binding protein n=1 Tax=Oryzias latipes TaxID=8090 RepID=UPI0000E9EE03|nr:synaptojanin-2-binding protein [Oryzias latipes]
MNGSLNSPTDPVNITLKRGPTGLGFNIVGGVDQRDAMNDSGIYVSKIKEDGAAALDGRLQEGDKILSINGTKLENMAHRQVVNIFRCAGNQVELHVLKRPKEDWTRHRPAPAGWTPSALPVLGFLLALSACAVLVVRRIRSSN